MNNTDITFQDSGETFAFVRNELSREQQFYQPTIYYEPHSNPPREWRRGEEWDHIEKFERVPVFWSGGEFALANWAYIADRGNGNVEVGKEYHIHIGISFQDFQPYFGIYGLDGGSTCLPGFRVRIEDDNWQIVTPRVFDGLWGIRLATKLYMAPVDLSVEYVPYSEYKNPERPPRFFSRLVYTIGGGGAAFPLLSSEATSDSESEYDSARILSATDSYDVR